MQQLTAHFLYESIEIAIEDFASLRFGIDASLPEDPVDAILDPDIRSGMKDLSIDCSASEAETRLASAVVRGGAGHTPRKLHKLELVEKVKTATINFAHQIEVDAISLGHLLAVFNDSSVLHTATSAEPDSCARPDFPPVWVRCVDMAEPFAEPGTRLRGRYNRTNDPPPRILINSFHNVDASDFQSVARKLLPGCANRIYLAGPAQLVSSGVASASLANGIWGRMIAKSLYDVFPQWRLFAYTRDTSIEFYSPALSDTQRSPTDMAHFDLATRIVRGLEDLFVDERRPGYLANKLFDRISHDEHKDGHTCPSCVPMTYTNLNSSDIQLRVRQPQDPSCHVVLPNFSHYDNFSDSYQYNDSDGDLYDSDNSLDDYRSWATPGAHWMLGGGRRY